MLHVNEISSEAEFERLLGDTSHKRMVVVDFFATWCGPCRQIAPHFVRLAESHPNVTFAKVDVDKLGEVAASQGIRAMPTFVAYLNGRALEKIEGANMPRLESLINTHAPKADHRPTTHESEAAGGHGPAPPAQIVPLPCSIEELYSGKVKKLKVSRKSTTADGASLETTDKVLEVELRPGWKAGTKITFEREGDALVPGGTPADVTFVIELKPHERYARNGDNLEVRVHVPLKRALLGQLGALKVAMPDGRELTVDTSDLKLVTPATRKVVANEGFPVPRSDRRGDLHVLFDIDFPTHLTDDTRRIIESIEL